MRGDGVISAESEVRNCVDSQTISMQIFMTYSNYQKKVKCTLFEGTYFSTYLDITNTRYNYRFLYPFSLLTVTEARSGITVKV